MELTCNCHLQSLKNSSSQGFYENYHQNDYDDFDDDGEYYGNGGDYGGHQSFGYGNRNRRSIGHFNHGFGGNPMAGGFNNFGNGGLSTHGFGNGGYNTNNFYNHGNNRRSDVNNFECDYCNDNNEYNNDNDYNNNNFNNGYNNGDDYDNNLNNGYNNDNDYDTNNNGNYYDNNGGEYEEYDFENYPDLGELGEEEGGQGEAQGVHELACSKSCWLQSIIMTHIIQFSSSLRPCEVRIQDCGRDRSQGQ